MKNSTAETKQTERSSLIQFSSPMGHDFALRSSRSSRLNRPTGTTTEESIFESKMLYEKDYFEYRFESVGEYTLKALNLPNVSLKIGVKETERLSQADLSASNMELSFLSSQSISQFLEKSNLLMRHDHKMSRMRRRTNYMFCKGESKGGEEICNYFGVKSSLMEKYEILNRMFGVSGRRGVEGEGEEMGRVFGQIRICPEPVLDMGREVGNIGSEEKENGGGRGCVRGNSGVERALKGKVNAFRGLEMERNSGIKGLRSDIQDFTDLKRELQYGNWECNGGNSSEANLDVKKKKREERLKNQFPSTENGCKLLDSERYLEFFRGRFE